MVMATDDGLKKHASEPEGIRGWLLLPLGGLFVTLYMSVDVFRKTTVVILGPEMWSAFATPSTVFYHSPWVPVMVIGGLIQVTIIICSAVALIATFRKKKFVPHLMIAVYALAFFLALLDVTLIYGFFPTISADWAKQMELGVIRKLLGTVAVLIIWVPYFLKSRRVQNTFVH